VLFFQISPEPHNLLSPFVLVASASTAALSLNPRPAPLTLDEAMAEQGHPLILMLPTMLSARCAQRRAHFRARIHTFLDLLPLTKQPSTFVSCCHLLPSGIVAPSWWRFLFCFWQLAAIPNPLFSARAIMESCASACDFVLASSGPNLCLLYCVR